MKIMTFNAIAERHSQILSHVHALYVPTVYLPMLVYISVVLSGLKEQTPSNSVFIQHALTRLWIVQ